MDLNTNYMRLLLQFFCVYQPSNFTCFHKTNQGVQFTDTVLKGCTSQGPSEVAFQVKLGCRHEPINISEKNLSFVTYHRSRRISRSIFDIVGLYIFSHQRMKHPSGHKTCLVENNTMPVDLVQRRSRLDHLAIFLLPHLLVPKSNFNQRVFFFCMCFNI